MQNVNALIQSVTVASSRCPGVRASVCWDRSTQLTNWFRLDSSTLDSGDILTLTSYANGVEPNELISQMDSFIYEDESENLISAEGTSDLWGDNFQSALSEIDLTLDNTTQRYTPSTDKNLIENPSFESTNGWNVKNTQGTNGGYELVGEERGIVSGSKAILIKNLGSGALTSNYLYSDEYPIVSGQPYTTSFFAKGTGDLTVRAVCIASGTFAVSSGTSTYSLNSGAFQRFSVTSGMHPWARKVRLDFAIQATKIAVVDCVQFEKGNLTGYENDFIGDFVLPRRPSKVHITMLDKPDGAGGTVPNFVGLTETLENQFKNDVINIHAYDFGTELQEKPAVTPVSTGAVMFVNQRSDVLLRHLAEMGGLVSDDYSFDVGKNTVPFFWVQEGSVWFYMSNVAEAEGGRIFFDETGILNFWNRDHIDNNSDSKFNFTMKDHIADFSYRIDKNEISNHIIVKTSPREVQENQVIWTLDSPTEIKAGENKTFWATLDDPITAATKPIART